MSSFFRLLFLLLFFSSSLNAQPTPNGVDELQVPSQNPVPPAPSLPPGIHHRVPRSGISKPDTPFVAAPDFLRLPARGRRAAAIRDITDLDEADGREDNMFEPTALVAKSGDVADDDLNRARFRRAAAIAAAARGAGAPHHLLHPIALHPAAGAGTDPEDSLDILMRELDTAYHKTDSDVMDTLRVTLTGVTLGPARRRSPSTNHHGEPREGRAFLARSSGIMFSGSRASGDGLK